MTCNWSKAMAIVRKDREGLVIFDEVGRELGFACGWV
jgi:hypothetical protein